jgi:FkbM family methyltransferase
MRNFKAMNYRITRLKNEWALSDNVIKLVYAGVGAKTEQKFLFSSSNSGNQSSISTGIGSKLMNDNIEGAQEVTVYALDDYFKEQQVTFIKADIESYELDMLHGAEAVIKRDKPLLAICIYHNASDMYTIPLFIKNMCKDYKFKIRHHTVVSSETVLYAYL